MRSFKEFLSVAAILGAGLGVSVNVAQADSVAGFYKGKTLRVIVASSAGGGYDAYSRVLADHIVRFLPGNPRAVVQNMPGAGGLRAANFLYVLSVCLSVLFQHHLIWFFQKTFHKLK